MEWLPWLPSNSCYTNLKFFETLKDTPNTSEGFRFVAFLVLEILGWVLFDPLVLGVGTKTLGTRMVNTQQHNLFSNLFCFNGDRHIEIVNVPLIKRDSAVYSKSEYNGPEIVKGKTHKSILPWETFF